MKKNKVITAVLTGVITTAIAATMCATASAATSSNVQSAKNPDPAFASMQNPFIECGDNMTKAAIKAGFIFNTPAYSNYTVIAADGIININLKIDENSEITISKAKGENEPGNCYDYTAINDTRLKDSNALFAVIDGKVYDAYWTADGYTYSISSEDGISVDDAIEYVTSITNAESTMN